MNPDELLGLIFPELRFSFSRSSGPGGQNVNKKNTKVELRWRFLDSKLLSQETKKRIAEFYLSKVNERNELVIVSQETRSQASNKAECLVKLRRILVKAMQRSKIRKKSNVPKGEKKKRLNAKRKRADTKENRKKLKF